MDETVKIPIRYVTSDQILMICKDESGVGYSDAVDNIKENIQTNKLKSLILDIKNEVLLPPIKTNWLESLIKYLDSLDLMKSVVLSGNIQASVMNIFINFDYIFCTTDTLFNIKELYQPSCKYGKLFKRKIGTTAFNRMKYLDDFLTAKDALENGIVAAIANAHEINDIALKYIESLVSNRPISTVQSIMKCFNSYKQNDMDYLTAFNYEVEKKHFCRLIYQDYYKAGSKG